MAEPADAKHRRGKCGARQTRRTSGAGWTRGGGLQQYRPGTRDGRKHSGGKKSRRWGVCRNHQPAGGAGIRSDCASYGYGVGTHHSCRGGSARLTCADAEIRGPIRCHLYTRCVRHCPRRCGIRPLVGRLDVVDRNVQGAGAAGHCLPLRAGYFDTRHRGQRSGCGCPARHPDQGWRVSGGGAQTHPHRDGQDRHHHRR